MTDDIIQINKHNRKLAISMRGGFIRVAGYLGLLRAFEEHGIKFDYFCGSSMGAIIAASYSSGLHIDDILELAKRKLHLFSLINLGSFANLTLTTHGVMVSKLTEIFGDTKIEDLPHKLLIQATNLETWDEDFIESGSLVDALSASCAFPFVTLPVELNGNQYIDGDMSASYGTSKLRSMGADVVIGLSSGKQNFGINHNSVPTRIADMLNIPLRKIRTLSNKLEPLDLLITDLGMDVFQLDFDKIDELVQHGYETGKAHVHQVYALLNKD